MSLQEVGCNTQCGWEVLSEELILNSTCNLVSIQSFWQKQLGLLLQMTKYYFYYVHMSLQNYEDTDNKNTLIRYEIDIVNI